MSRTFLGHLGGVHETLQLTSLALSTHGAMIDHLPIQKLPSAALRPSRARGEFRVRTWTRVCVVTREPGGTDSATNALPSITEPRPTVVLPPNIVALA